MTQERTFAGTVKAGRFVPENAPGWLVALGALEGKRVIVTIQTEKQRRSLAMNRRYWSLVVPVGAEILTAQAKRVLPFSKDETHWLLKGAFIGWEDTPLGRVPKSSKNLTTEEFMAFTRRCESWMLDHGVVLPEHGEEL